MEGQISAPYSQPNGIKRVAMNEYLVVYKYSAPYRS